MFQGSIEVVEKDFFVAGTQKIKIETGEVIGEVRETRLLLYVSGPMYSEGWIGVNVNIAAWAGEEAYKRGWAPVIPQFDVLGPMITKVTFRDRYMDVDLALIRVSAAVLVLPYTLEKDEDGNQTGTSEELEFAESLGIPIYSLETLPYVN